MKYKIIKEQLMYLKKRQAFTMIELVFVIVVIGILSAIAIPKLAATRDDAVITKAISTLSAVRSSLATERQKRILRGDFTPLTSLGGTAGTLFDYYNGDVNESAVLEYPISPCATGARGCWVKTSNTVYTYKMPHNSSDVAFTLDPAKFRLDCVRTGSTGADCIELTR